MSIIIFFFFFLFSTIEQHEVMILQAISRQILSLVTRRFSSMEEGLHLLVSALSMMSKRVRKYFLMIVPAASASLFATSTNSSISSLVHSSLFLSSSSRSTIAADKCSASARTRTDLAPLIFSTADLLLQHFPEWGTDIIASWIFFFFFAVTTQTDPDCVKADIGAWVLGLLNVSSSSRQEQMQQFRAISDFPKHPSDLAARSAAAVVVVLFLFADTCTGQHDENSQWEFRSTAGHDELRMSARATLQPETRASAITAIASRWLFSLLSSLWMLFLAHSRSSRVWSGCSSLLSLVWTPLFSRACLLP